MNREDRDQSIKVLLAPCVSGQPLMVTWSYTRNGDAIKASRNLYKKGWSRRLDHRIGMEKERGKSGEEEMRKGPWREDEDEALVAAISVLGGERRWASLAKALGLRRKWEELQVEMDELPSPESETWSYYSTRGVSHYWPSQKMGWSRIARSLPGRTDNEIKNYSRSHLKKKPHFAQAMELTFSSSNTNKWDEKSTAGVSDQASSSNTPPSCCDSGDHKSDNAATINKLTSTSLD